MGFVRLRPVTKIVYTALLLGLNILLNRLVGMAQVGPLFSFARIAPGTSIVLFASILLGPFSGALVGVAGDALGWLILGQWTGTFNFFLSIYYAIIGICPYFVARFFVSPKTKGWAKFLIYPLAGALLAMSLLAIWFAPGIATLFGKAGFDLLVARIVATSIVVVLAGGSLLAYWLLMKRYVGKQTPFLGDLTLEAMLGVSLFNEILACLLKPLAFMAFYSLVLGQSFADATGFDYAALVVITGLFAMINVPLNAFLLSLYCRYGHYLIKGERV